MDEFTYHIVYKGGLAVKIMNILLICFVIIVGSSLVFNKKAMSQSLVDASNIVMMNIQDGKTILVYHKSSNTFLLYGQPDPGSKNKGLQLMQIRSLSQDFLMAEKLSQAESELVSNEKGYTVEYIRQKVDVALPKRGSTKTLQGGHYPSPRMSIEKTK